MINTGHAHTHTHTHEHEHEHTHTWELYKHWVSYACPLSLYNYLVLQVDIDKQKQYGCEDDIQVQYKHEQVKIKGITGTLVYNR